MTLRELLGIEVPVIQAPMAGVQLSALAVAVANGGALGSLRCAMLAPKAMRTELEAIGAGTAKPCNVNFFCHAPPAPDAAREARWREALAPYYREYGIDADRIPAGPGRNPFGAQAAEVLAEFRPRVVSFHFGLPSDDLVARVESCGAKILCSATTVAEARWLEAHGADAIIAQGVEAGRHRGIFLADDLTMQVGTFALVPQVLRAVKVPVIAPGRRPASDGVARPQAAGAPSVQGGAAHRPRPGTPSSTAHLPAC